ncbi:MAG: hypothetical protein EA424_22280 [Planctomycetaceae bacterium]|nr:MAG: hypothetical protein EA424_22280 [Planctomycetaceae bacterium]
MNGVAERIQRRMNELRGQLDNDVEEVVDSAKELTDWRTYVRRYPWACVGLAAVIGYLVVPSRLELESPDVDTLLELAQQNKLVVDANPPPRKREGLASTAFRFLLHAAGRSALSYLGQKASELAARDSDSADERNESS